MKSMFAPLALCLAGLLCGLEAGFAQTWSTRVSGSADNLTAVVFSSASTAVTVGANGEVIRSSDGGASWAHPITGSDNLNAVAFSGAFIAAVGDDVPGGGNGEAISRSPDRAASWFNLVVPDVPNTGDDMLSVVFSSASTVVAVGTNGEVIRSINSGATWTNPFTSAGGQDLNAVASTSALIIAAGDDIPGGGNGETIVRSLDRGANWGDIVVPNVPNTGENMLDLQFISASTVVAVGTSGEVIRSTDSGAIWTNPFTHTSANNLRAVDARGNIVVAVGVGGAIARSADGGAIWTEPVSGTGAQLNDVLMLTTSHVLAVGAGGVIIVSTDGGVTWSSQSSGTSATLNALAFDSNNAVLAVGASGTILLSLDQLAISGPIPFRSKWLLALLLVGYALYALNKMHRAV